MKAEVYKNTGGCISMCILDDDNSPISITEGWETAYDQSVIDSLIKDAVDQLKRDNDAWKGWDGDMVDGMNDRGGRYVGYNSDGTAVTEPYTLETLYDDLADSDELIASYDI